MRDRNQLEHLSRRRAELGDARENRVANGRRNPLLPRQKHLRDEEGVAAGRRDRASSASTSYGSASSRPRPATKARARSGRPLVDGRHVSENDSQWVIDLELVVRYVATTSAPTLHDPASEEAEHVEGCLVGPVEILDDENRRARAQLGEKRARDIVRLTVAGYDGSGGSPSTLCAISTNGPRGRGVKRASHAPERVGQPLCSAQNVAHQGRLPDAGLAADQQKSACPGERSSERSTQALERQLSFEEERQRRPGRDAQSSRLHRRGS